MKIALNECTFGEAEIEAAIAVLRSGQVTMGKLCAEFEKVFAEKLGVKNAVFVNSGSSANLLAFFALANPLLKAFGSKRMPKPGMEIIVPAVTWSTTIWPIVQAGFVPVLVDSDPETLQINIEAVKKAITPQTIAICPVHVLGNAVPLRELTPVAKEHGLWLIEDSCEALGTKTDGRYTGTLGDMGTYSFYFSHHITTIEGGMFVCADDDLAELARCLRAHGWTRQLKDRQKIESQHPEIDPRFLFINTGFNLRATEINAAFGLEQIKKLDTFNGVRRDVAAAWVNAFADLPAIKPMRTTTGTESTWFGFPVLLADTPTRDALRLHLEAKGIETRPIICGNLARQPAFKLIPHRISGFLHGADQIMDRGLFWGSHPNMGPKEIDYIAAAVREFFGK